MLYYNFSLHKYKKEYVASSLEFEDLVIKETTKLKLLKAVKEALKEHITDCMLFGPDPYYISLPIRGWIGQKDTIRIPLDSSIAESVVTIVNKGKNYKYFNS